MYVHLSVLRDTKDGAEIALFHVIGGAKNGHNSTARADTEAITGRFMASNNEIQTIVIAKFG